ncbi:MAG: alpha/beta fold hydrolase [Pseudomonadota bacterium]
MAERSTIFIHGLESSSKGTKALFFKELYPEMIVPDFKGDLDERMARLTTILGNKKNLLMIGSSFGGLMGALFSLKYPDRVRKLVLLAPALCFREYKLPDSETIDVPVIIYHGNKDDVVPLEPVREIAHKVFSNLIFHVVDDDHLLHKTFKEAVREF